MKKIILFLLGIFIIGGCANDNIPNVVKKFGDISKKTKSYKMSGKMELLNDEEVYNYNIDVSYLKDNYYIVEMTNVTNDHKQVILRNNEGLYVVTPSLNKSFKFESEWPDNSSQAYILSAIVNDLESDDNTKTIKQDNGYVLKSKVNYPNNSELKYQKIYLDEKYNLKMVEVYGDADLPKIKVIVDDLDLKAGLKQSDFDLKNFISVDSCDGEKCPTKETMGSIESAIYPLYMPANTYLSSSELVNAEEASRVILTFSGDRNFVIVEEKTSIYDDHEIIPVYGEPVMINDSIAALSSNSLYWTSNDVDYYIVGEDLSVSEMVFIATSLGRPKQTISTK